MSLHGEIVGFFKTLKMQGSCFGALFKEWP